MIDTQRTLAYDQLFLCWRLPQDSAPAWHFSVEYRRRGVVPGGASRGGFRGGLAAARWGWQRLDEVSGTSAVIDRLEMDSVYVLRVRGCNKAGYGEYSEEVYLHTPPAPGEMRVHLTDTVPGGLWHGEIQLDTTEHVTTRTLHNGLTLNKIDGSIN